MSKLYDKDFVIGQLKLSKKQHKDERYDYLCGDFNGITYCIKLEKYTNKLQSKLNKLTKQLEEERNKRLKAIDWIKDIQVIILEQPSENKDMDNWFIGKLNSIKEILGDDDNETLA